MKRQHDSLRFSRAFPNSVSEYHDAHSRLQRVDETTRTQVHYRFSFPVAKWLARKAPGSVSIDWSEIDNCERLDEMLRQILQPPEEDYFDSGYATSQDWMELASAEFPGTDFDWLLAQIQERRPQKVWAQLYDAADLPLVWDIGDSNFSKSRNVFPVESITTRTAGMRARPLNAKKEVRRPLPAIEKLSRQRGALLVDVAMASLAARYRETNHFNYANPDEVYLADVGEGVSIAVFGMAPEYRYPLECTMGFLILANGMPIGYGGSSALFLQVNTGLNIFDEYRRSEASYLWVQVLRTYHALVTCTRFVVNPYQFGAENPEALSSGAFWFYYRLGFRPVDTEVRKLAKREAARRLRSCKYRSDKRMLRRLASCNMHLTLPAARQSEFFDEDWLATSSMLATKELAAVGESTRSKALRRIAEKLASDVGIRSLRNWSRSERRALEQMAPIVAATRPFDWPNDAKASMRAVLRAKGGLHEASYARLLGEHEYFRSALRASCRSADR